ncbi:MAG TPA: MMPL family transporter, partial [Chitinophaga sp.]
MGYYAKQVQLSYEFTGAIPTDNPKFREYQQFKQKFGEDGNMLVLAVQNPQFFALPHFTAYQALTRSLKAVEGVENILSVAGAVDLVKNDSTHKLVPVPIFPASIRDAAQLDSAAALFRSRPFYTGQLYNPATNSYLMAVRINKDVMSSARRNVVVQRITQIATDFGKAQQEAVYLSGLPLIRTTMATKVADELKFFLQLSFVLTALILFAFFRSVSAVVMSMIVVAIGVTWSVATIVLLGYKITLLTGIIPPLIVVIGIPNCVYFLNKYHTEYAKCGNKQEALIRMIQRMGIVTLFTNITAAIGFGVFYFTKSSILKQFGVVAGLNILWIFVISFIFLPAVLSYLPPPKSKHTTYLDSKFFNSILGGISRIVFHYRKAVYAITVVLAGLALAGMWRLQSVGFIVDDIPHTDKLYTDLKFFEKNFKGVMPLEIAIDTKKKN